MMKVFAPLLGLLALGAIAMLTVANLTACAINPSAGAMPANEFTFNTLTVATAAVELDRSYDRMSAMISAHFGDYTPAEQATLLSIDSALRAIRAQLHLKAGNNSEKLTALITLAELKNVYFAARDSYTQAKMIIQPKLSGLDAAELFQIEQFDGQARALDEAMLPLLTATTAATDITPAVQELLTTGAMVAKLVLLLK